MTSYNVDTLRKLIAEKRFGSAYLYVDYLEERLSKVELLALIAANDSVIQQAKLDACEDMDRDLFMDKWAWFKERQLK